MNGKLDMESKKISDIQSVFLKETFIDFNGYKATKKGAHEFRKIFNAYLWFLNEYTNLSVYEIGDFLGYSSFKSHPVQVIRQHTLKYGYDLKFNNQIRNQHGRLIKSYELQIESHKTLNTVI